MTLWGDYLFWSCKRKLATLYFLDDMEVYLGDGLSARRCLVCVFMRGEDLDMARDFKAILKAFRLRAGFGLREFAELIGDAPSNYVNIESGKRKPWKSLEKLRSVAEALALREGSQDWDAFIVTAARQLWDCRQMSSTC